MRPAGIIVVAEQQRPDIGTASFRLAPADDDELLSVEAFRLAPQAAVAGHISRVGPLGYDPLNATAPARNFVESRAAPLLMVAGLQARRSTAEQSIQPR